MYLALLNEKEKNWFLKLAYHLSYIDGDCSEKERDMIESYCNEMKIPMKETLDHNPVEKIINKIVEDCHECAKKIIIFEVVGLAMSDNRYELAEKDFIHYMAGKFGIGKGFVQKCESAILEYTAFQNKLNQLIIG